MNKLRGLLRFALIIGTTASLAAQTGQKQATSPNSQPPQAVPVMDGGAGPCSLDLTVTADGKAAAVVKINVHIVYGFER